MTLALSAYLDAVQRQNAGKADRFDLIAATQDENGSSLELFPDRRGQCEGVARASTRH